MDALATSKMGRGKPPMLKIVEDEVSRQEVLDAEEKLFESWKAKKNGFVHIKCRASPYLKASRIRRFPVPNTKIYWEVCHASFCRHCLNSYVSKKFSWFYLGLAKCFLCNH